MSDFNYPCIVFSERLSTGIVVHFEDGVSVYFPAAFLYEQRDAQLNTVFREGEEGGDPPHDETTRYRRFMIKIIGGTGN